jgi:hypothetical protein
VRATDAEAPVGEYRPTGRSALASKISVLPRRMRRALGLNDYLLAAVDGLVTLCAIVIEEADEPLVDRISAAKSEFAILGETPSWIATTLTTASEEELLDRVKRLFATDGKKVLNRMLGTAAYSALAKGLDQDLRTVLRAVQVGTSYFRPWAVAMDDALAALSPAQRADAGLIGDVGASMFAAILNVQELIGATLIDETQLRFPEGLQPVDLTHEQLTDAASEFRTLIQSRADENLAELGTALARKLEGARDALEYSADGVSQAANSLVELLDRMAREAFSEATVMDWLAGNSLQDPKHVFVAQDGSRRPTKRAQFLCLAWAGGPVNEQPNVLNLQKLIALALVNVREKLQKLKHSDAGTEEERELLLRLLNTIEGSTMILARACWGAAGKQRVSELHQRLIAG